MLHEEKEIQASLFFKLFNYFCYSTTKVCCGINIILYTQIFVW
jgi:hypothetical protein